MASRSGDRDAGARRRPGPALILIEVVAMLCLYALIVHALVVSFGIKPSLASSEAFVAFLLVAIPAGLVWRRTGRGRATGNTQAGTGKPPHILRGFFIIALMALLAVMLHDVVLHRDSLGAAGRWDLAGLALIVSVGGHGSLFPTDATTVSRMRWQAARRAAMHGLIALLFTLAGAIAWLGLHPDTMSISLPSAIMAGLLVSQISLAVQERRRLAG